MGVRVIIAKEVVLIHVDPRGVFVTYQFHSYPHFCCSLLRKTYETCLFYLIYQGPGVTLSEFNI